MTNNQKNLVRASQIFAEELLPEFHNSFLKNQRKTMTYTPNFHLTIKRNLQCFYLVREGFSFNDLQMIFGISSQGFLKSNKGLLDDLKTIKEVEQMI